MRAFMSNSDDRRTKEIDTDQLGFASAFQWNLAAEREARAILAETEPIGGANRIKTTFSRAGDPRGGFFVEANGALAEALEAFVGDAQ